MQYVANDRLDIGFQRNQDPLTVAEFKKKAEKALTLELIQAVRRSVKFKYEPIRHGECVTALQCEAAVFVFTVEEMKAHNKRINDEGIACGRQEMRRQVEERLFE